MRLCQNLWVRQTLQQVLCLIWQKHLLEKSSRQVQVVRYRSCLVLTWCRDLIHKTSCQMMHLEGSSLLLKLMNLARCKYKDLLNDSQDLLDRHGIIRCSGPHTLPRPRLSRRGQQTREQILSGWTVLYLFSWQPANSMFGRVSILLAFVLSDEYVSGVEPSVTW